MLKFHFLSFSNFHSNRTCFLFLLNHPFLPNSATDSNPHASLSALSPDRPRSSPASRPTGRRRHLTTLNRAPDYSTIPEETGHQLNDPPTEQTSPSQPNEEKAIHCCCCPKSRLLLCSPAYCSKLPDLIIQHQPVIMSADVHFEQQPPISQPIDSLTSKLALVYTSQWVENDVFLPANQSYAPNVHHPMDGNQMNHPQANNQAINRVNNLLNHQRNQDNSGNQENGQQFGQQFGQQHSPQRSQLNKSVDSCSPRIVRCSLNSALYQYNPRLKAKIMMNARRSASVSLPIDHETLRQVGYSLRMISEQFHLQRLQANAVSNSILLLQEKPVLNEISRCDEHRLL